MNTILLSDFKITPILDSVKRLNMSDEEYFSEKYKDYVSNSRLKYISPDEGGSPSLYKNGITSFTTNSLQVGSAVHELFLQPEEFVLGEDILKPGAKLGSVAEFIVKYRSKGLSIKDSILQSCIDSDYYTNSMNDKKVKSVIQKCFHFYFHSKKLSKNTIVLPSKDRDRCISCLDSLNRNNRIVNLIRPDNIISDIKSFNEDALFMDVLVSYKDRDVVLKLKMKADNWTIDEYNKTLILNDLKTTGKPVGFFMKDYGSFEHFHYARQMAFYMWVLSQYCKKEYNFNKEWNFSSNMLVVETFGDFNSVAYSVSDSKVNEGKKDLAKLLKMVAYCELYGYSDDLVFI